MRVAIIGSRGFSNWELFSRKVSNILSSTTCTAIISGGAKGADSMAKRYAEQNNYPYIEYLPQYDLYDKRAPLVRNIKIIESSEAVIAFHDGKSKGTLHALTEAKKRNLPVRVINV